MNSTAEHYKSETTFLNHKAPVLKANQNTVWQYDSTLEQLNSNGAQSETWLIDSQEPSHHHQYLQLWRCLAQNR